MTRATRAQLPAIVDEGFFVLRAPSLPLDWLVGWSDGVEVSRLTSPAEVEAARACLIDRLRHVVEDSRVSEALFVASPALHHRTTAWTSGRQDSDGKLINTLVRYFSRMTCRCTPFGLFAGWCTGEIGDVTRLPLAGLGSAHRHARIDIAQLLSLVRHLERIPALRCRLTFRPNTSAYRVADSIRYAEATDVADWASVYAHPRRPR